MGNTILDMDPTNYRNGIQNPNQYLSTCKNRASMNYQLFTIYDFEISNSYFHHCRINISQCKHKKMKLRDKKM